MNFLKYFILMKLIPNHITCFHNIWATYLANKLTNFNNILFFDPKKMKINQPLYAFWLL